MTDQKNVAFEAFRTKYANPSPAVRHELWTIGAGISFVYGLWATKIALIHLWVWGLCVHVPLMVLTALGCFGLTWYALRKRSVAAHEEWIAAMDRWKAAQA